MQGGCAGADAWRQWYSAQLTRLATRLRALKAPEANSLLRRSIASGSGSRPRNARYSKMINYESESLSLVITC